MVGGLGAPVGGAPGRADGRGALLGARPSLLVGTAGPGGTERVADRLRLPSAGPAAGDHDRMAVSAPCERKLDSGRTRIWAGTADVPRPGGAGDCGYRCGVLDRQSPAGRVGSCR